MASAIAKTTQAPAFPLALADVRSPYRQQITTPSSHSIGLPSLPVPPQSSSPTLHAKAIGSGTSASHRRKIGRNVITKVTEEALIAKLAEEAPTEVVTELPEIVKTIQEAWDKLEDKFALTSLAFSVLIALYGATGIISAIDRLPLVPGLFELVGIGYTGARPGVPKKYSKKRVQARTRDDTRKI